MKISDLAIPQRLKELLNRLGYVELYPPQEEAFKTGILNGRSLILSSPTASGKTLVAEICAIKRLMEDGGKILYLTPLRALAWEKYEVFQNYTELARKDGRKIQVGISTGDLDSSTPWLERYDVIITTNEKCDSLLRHNAQWLSSVSMVVADEIHLIGDDRGPTLEVALTRLRQIKPDIQIIALSATVRNADEIAEWLNAECVSKPWRPVPLKEGVVYKDVITFSDGSSKRLLRLSSSDPINVALNTVAEGGQSLIFVESRQRAVSLAKESALSLAKNGLLQKKLIGELNELSSKILVQGEKTRLSDELASAISMGGAFHHAGLSAAHRRIVEDSFRSNKIKILVATPTLAAGVNLPARTVVIANYRRFMTGYGMYPISVMEYKQMSGRAGRPQYDDFGESVIVASSHDNIDMLMEDYVFSNPERIYSRLASEASLKGHVLASISSKYVHSERELLEFFGKTFYGYHYDPRNLSKSIATILEKFDKEDMIRYDKDYIHATSFGKRISELYINPESAVIIRDGLKRGAVEVTDFTWLHMVCQTPDMRPILRPRRSEVEVIENYIDEHRSEFALPIEIEEDDYIGYEQFIGEVKTAIVLNKWIEESSENDLLESFSVEPGDRYNVVLNAEWLLYSTRELARVLGISTYNRHLLQLTERVKYGVTPQLLPLVKLRGIGRIRARVLYNSGFKTIASLKRAPISKLTEIPLIGARLAKQIKEQVGGQVQEDEWARLEEDEAEQKMLTEFIGDEESH
ncbi:MAG: DEAD/DEAH box helicase [Candidatus Bathyarchaeia archaeon]